MKIIQLSKKIKCAVNFFWRRVNLIINYVVTHVVIQKAVLDTTIALIVGPRKQIEKAHLDWKKIDDYIINIERPLSSRIDVNVLKFNRQLRKTTYT